MTETLLELKIATTDTELQLAVSVNGTTHTFGFDSVDAARKYLAQANIDVYKLIGADFDLNDYNIEPVKK